MKVFVISVIGGLLAASAACGAALAADAEARLKEKNIILPAPNPPVANYIGAVQVGNLLFVSGHTSNPQWTHKGKVGKDLTVEEGAQAARQAGLNLLSTARAALGSLDRVKRVVKVLGMVNSADGFGDQPKVINGFSDLLVDVFGDAIGKHARSAVGMAALPGNAPWKLRQSSKSNDSLACSAPVRTAAPHAARQHTATSRRARPPWRRSLKSLAAGSNQHPASSNVKTGRSWRGTVRLRTSRGRGA